jgi:CheY-like chemotaxis protein
MHSTPAAAPRKVLIVEDEALVRELSAEFLHEAGYTVLEAGNAEQALRTLEGDPAIGIVFTDIEMPGALDGVALSWRVRERWPHIGVVVTSGRVLPQSSHIPGDSRFLRKPYSANALLTSVAACLAPGAVGLRSA